MDHPDLRSDTLRHALFEYNLQTVAGTRARVVALDYPVPGWREEKRAEVKSEGNVEYTLFLYRR